MIDSPTGSDLSRRSLVKTAATVAAAGGVLALAGPATAASADAPGVPEQLPAGRHHENRHHRAGTQVMVRVLDERLGVLEVYGDDAHHTLTDRALAAQLVRLAR